MGISTYQTTNPEPEGIPAAKRLELDQAIPGEELPAVKPTSFGETWNCVPSLPVSMSIIISDGVTSPKATGTEKSTTMFPAPSPVTLRIARPVGPGLG